jgi:ankyrin repeat protein
MSKDKDKKKKDKEENDEIAKEDLHYGDDGRLLLDAAKRGNVALMEELIKENKNIDPNCRDGLGNGPLHYSAAAGHLDTATILLKRLKADPNLQNLAGDTPLHKAVEADHLPMIKLLMEYGAKPDIPNKKKRKPTDVCQSKDAREMLKIKEKIQELEMDPRDIANESDTDSE